MEFRNLKGGDLEWVGELFETELSQAWPLQHVAMHLEKDGAGIACFIKGEGVGFIFSQSFGPEIEILYIAVKKSARKGGVAKKMIQYLIAQTGINSGVVQLEVSDQNAVACHFYKSFGFVEVNRRKNYYRDGSDALLMDYKWSLV